MTADGFFPRAIDTYPLIASPVEPKPNPNTTEYEMALPPLLDHFVGDHLGITDTIVRNQFKPLYTWSEFNVTLG